jgi:Phage tail assembly chaperone proteins, E, or 41 or 14
MADEKPREEFAIEYPLDEPIKAYNEEVKVLKLRKPNGNDLIQVGSPVIFYPHVEPPKIEFDMPKVIAMLARLSNTPSSSIAMIGPQDLTGLAWAISPFFIPGQ